MNYNNHAPPHVHIKYQDDVNSYRLEIRNRRWLKPGGELPSALKQAVEAWVEQYEVELLEQWDNARNHLPIVIVG